ncbi:SMP-30/gluconolactonase/LRE family protein [Altericroceibacterium spongiae]|uniref:SMP-30/gluconolactonase/LRE family protein n=1 Tax=Altericroceibacterium spongiae TaxID=2320269 RepID=A0A420EAF5_9SPHN|nr:SMP-30/gluconolactonase/LRE family protein [Altericroceibacterium spongiae]RKF17640.1 SMP-30/gluconolactonase/LRE family protein [Altericroceibacterium spongiae]
MTPQLAWECACLLGEGPVWLEAEQALRFVDIKGRAVLRYDPASGRGERLETGGMPSFIYPTDGDALLFGSEQQLKLLYPDGHVETHCDIPEPGRNRTNDGAVDPDGRLWFGLSDMPEDHPGGELRCYDRGRITRKLDGVTVPNGPAICTEGRLLYHVDSPNRAIWRFTIAEDGSLTDHLLFTQIEEQAGYPDGVVLDAEGCLWVALWDGWGVRRYGPDGQLLDHIPFPCARVTKLAFGGPDLTTAFITTARGGLSEAELADQPLAGSLFTFESPVAGHHPHRVKLS